MSAPEGVRDPRALHANERTLLAWIRTGLALITFGFGIAQLEGWLDSLGHRVGLRGPVVIGALFVILGTLGEAAAVVRYLRIRHALLRGQTVPVASVGVVLIVAVTVALLGAVLVFYVFKTGSR